MRARKEGPGFVAGLLAAALLTPAGLTAQALPFHTETAISTGFDEEAARTFISLLGRQGLLRNGDEIADPMGRDIDVFAQPVAALPFAITPTWTTRVVVPFVRKSMEFTTPDGVQQSYATRGVSDVLVDTKWIFLTRNRLRGTTKLGIEGAVAAPALQVGSGVPGGFPSRHSSR